MNSKLIDGKSVRTQPGHDLCRPVGRATQRPPPQRFEERLEQLCQKLSRLETRQCELHHTQRLAVRPPGAGFTSLHVLSVQDSASFLA